MADTSVRPGFPVGSNSDWQLQGRMVLPTLSRVVKRLPLASVSRPRVILDALLQ